MDITIHSNDRKLSLFHNLLLKGRVGGNLTVMLARTKIFFSEIWQVLGIYVLAEGSKCSVVVADWSVCVADISGPSLDGDMFLTVFSFLCSFVVYTISKIT